MATIWMSASGTNTNSGTNSSVPKKTLYGTGNAITAAGDGGTINVMNTGTHAMTSIASNARIAGTFSGTNYTTDPGLVIQGVTANGTAAMATVASAGTKKYWLDTQGNFVLIKGIKFDYSAEASGSTSGMSAIVFSNSPAVYGAHKVQDCECWFTSTVGSGVTISNANTPKLLEFGTDVSSGSVRTIEVVNCVLVNVQLFGDGCSSYRVYDYHQNVLIWDAVGPSASASMVSFDTGGNTAGHKFYQNTVVQRRHGTGTLSAMTPMVQSPGDDGNSGLYNYNNLYYGDSRTGSTSYIGDFLLKGVTGSGTNANIVGYNYWAIGPNAKSAPATWTNNTKGYSSYQYHYSYQNGTAWASCVGNVIAPTSVSATNVALSTVFTSVSAHTWTPGSYAHNLPYDLRPRVGTTMSDVGSYVGALLPGNPTATADSYTVESGGSLTVPVGTGVLANDTDPSGLALTATLETDVASGVLVLASNGSFTYSAVGVSAGTVTFTYRAVNTLSLQSTPATVTITVTPPPATDPGISDPVADEARSYIDSYPFYKPLIKATMQTMVRVKKNRSYHHIDVRHYLKEHVHDESTHRIAQLAASSSTTFTLGGVDKSTGFLMTTNHTLTATVTYYNGTTNATFSTTLTGLLTLDQCKVRQVEVTNTSSSTATVEMVVFD